MTSEQRKEDAQHGHQMVLCHSVAHVMWLHSRGASVMWLHSSGASVMWLHSSGAWEDGAHAVATTHRAHGAQQVASAHCLPDTLRNASEHNTFVSTRDESETACRQKPSARSPHVGMSACLRVRMSACLHVCMSACLTTFTSAKFTSLLLGPAPPTPPARPLAPAAAPADLLPSSTPPLPLPQSPRLLSIPVPVRPALTASLCGTAPTRGSPPRSDTTGEMRGRPRKCPCH